MRRLAYVGNFVPGDHSWTHDRCPGKFCPHAVFAEVVAAFRDMNVPTANEHSPSDANSR
jgi:hypothetical protein